MLRDVRRASERVYIRLTAGLIERTDRFVADLRQLERVPRDRAARTRLVATVGHLVATIPGRDLLLRGLTVEADRSLLALGRDVLAEAVRCSEPGATAAAGGRRSRSAAGSTATALRPGRLSTGPSTPTPTTRWRTWSRPPCSRVSRPWIWTSIMAELTPEELLASARHGQERSPA